MTGATDTGSPIKGIIKNMKQFSSDTKNMTPSRRSVVAAGLWSAPAILATSAIPAYAASPTELVGATPYAWQETHSKRKYYAAENRTAFAGGFISTIPGTDFNEQFTRNTNPARALNTSNDPNDNLSLGFWLESDNGLPVTGKILSIDIVHTLSPWDPTKSAYKPEQSYFTESVSPGVAMINSKGDTIGHYDWSSPSIVPAPWTISGYNTQQVVLNWTNPGIETEVSTSDPYTGYRVPGYFLNFNLTGTTAAVTRVTTVRTIVWEDVNGQHTKTWTVESRQ